MPAEMNDIMGQIQNLQVDDRRNVGASLLQGMNSRDTSYVLGALVNQASTESVRSILAEATQRLPVADKKATVRETVANLPEAERKEIIQEIANLGPPSSGARDKLWLIVVSAFAFVLIASAAALGAGVFVAVPTGAKVNPELILTMFTSVVGFLAGLFVPSPAANK